MNSTTAEGQGQNIAGSVKEAAGKITGDDQLQATGVADQFAGNTKQVVGAAKDAVANPGPLVDKAKADAVANPGPLVDKAKAFAKDRPWATAALVGTLGIALINTLRGKQSS